MEPLDNQTEPVQGEPAAWDPGPTIRAMRRYARKLDLLFEEMIEWEAKIPRPTRDELREVRELKFPLSVSAHLLAVVDAATTAIDNAVVGLREGSRKRSLAALDQQWRDEIRPEIEVFDQIDDALEYFKGDDLP